tara:strand:+ start:94 stop:783 length:690 start_codon:yes stop_codon:yes gene_type:complete
MEMPFVQNKDYSSLERKIGYSFQNGELLAMALTHRSAGSPNNERLEYLGDAVLGLIIADELYGSGYGEAQMSLIRATLVKQDTLADLAREIALGDYLNLGVGARNDGGTDRSSILADSLEALIGAIHLDGGITVAGEFVRDIFSSRMSGEFEKSLKDSKTILQERVQALGLALPKYGVVEVYGPAHQREFKVRCEILELGLSADAVGNSRKRAEQAAATDLLPRIENSE